MSVSRMEKAYQKLLEAKRAGRVGKRKAVEWCATAIGKTGPGYGYTRGSMCFYRKADAERYAKRRNKANDPHYITKREVVREVILGRKR